jgi:hypothetical protein
MSDEMADLRLRLAKAYTELSELADEAKRAGDVIKQRRLLAKRSGVALAQDYLRSYRL